MVQGILQAFQQILPLDIAVAAHKGIHDLSLAAGTAEIAVGIQLSDPGVGQGLFTVQRLDTGCEAAAGFLVDFGGLILTELQLHTAQKIDDLGELGEVHLNVTVYVQAEIAPQGVVQQLGTAFGIGSVDAVIVVSGDGDVQIPVTFPVLR